MPGRKFTLSTFRTRTSTSKFSTALSAGALALATLAVSGGLSASAVAQPVSPVRASAGASPAGGDALVISSAKALSFHSAAFAMPRLSRTKTIAWRMMHLRFHWSSRHQFRYLNELWTRESSWNVHATNPYSGAYGIPQAVPGSKMATAGPDWQNSARTQIRWGLGYIKGRYGTPHRAWDHELAYGWY